jgi:hypothetical protein
MCHWCALTPSIPYRGRLGGQQVQPPIGIQIHGLQTLEFGEG